MRVVLGITICMSALTLLRLILKGEASWTHLFVMLGISISVQIFRRDGVSTWLQVFASVLNAVAVIAILRRTWPRHPHLVSDQRHRPGA